MTPPQSSSWWKLKRQRHRRCGGRWPVAGFLVIPSEGPERRPRGRILSASATPNRERLTRDRRIPRSISASLGMTTSHLQPLVTGPLPRRYRMKQWKYFVPGSRPKMYVSSHRAGLAGPSLHQCQRVRIAVARSSPPSRSMPDGYIDQGLVVPADRCRAGRARHVMATGGSTRSRPCLAPPGAPGRVISTPARHLEIALCRRRRAGLGAAAL
jgi:hypothetical protein